MLGIPPQRWSVHGNYRLAASSVKSAETIARIARVVPANERLLAPTGRELLARRRKPLERDALVLLHQPREGRQNVSPLAGLDAFCSLGFQGLTPPG
jgi:hypothetical protein